MSLTVSSASLQLVPALVEAIVAGAPYNPTGDQVAFAFTTPGTSPMGAQWWPGSWDSTSPAGGGSWYTALCLVGPGGTVQLAPGSYQVWVKVTDNPEVPVLPAFLLTISC